MKKDGSVISSIASHYDHLVEEVFLLGIEKEAHVKSLKMTKNQKSN